MELSRLLTQLNLETREHHVEADGAWLALMVSDVTKAHYMRQLVNVYGFDSPLESAFAYTPGLDRVITGREQTRCGLLALDLLNLGMSPAQLSGLPQCYWITPFRSVGEALGWMYVAERSTLLHAAVRHHLRATIPDAPVAYLAAHQGEGPARWRAFGAALDRYAEQSGKTDEIFDGAYAAFRTHRSWLRGEQGTMRA